MIYLLYGNDTAQARKKLNSLLKTLFARKPDAALIRMDNEHFTEEQFEMFAGMQGLFEQKSIIVLDSLCSDANHKDTVLKNLPELEMSENVFILLEKDIDAKTRAKIEKHAEKVQEFSVKGAKGTKSSFNIFELSDALGERNKKKVWVTYQIGKQNNISS